VVRSPPNCTTIVTCSRDRMPTPGFPRLDTNSRLLSRHPSPRIYPQSLAGKEGWAMSVSRSGNWRSVWVVATVWSASIIPASAWAYTAEQQQACMSDAFRLCSAEIPSIDRITACMGQHRSQLSPACRAQFTSAPGPVASDEGPDDVASVTTHKRHRSHRVRRTRADLDD
jgi:hypothetical protein